MYDTKVTVKITGFFIYRPTKINQYQTGWCLWPSCFMDHEESPTIWRLPTEKGSPDIPRRRWKADLSSRHKEIRIFTTSIHWFTHLTRWYLSYHTEINSCYNKRRLCVCWKGVPVVVKCEWNVPGKQNQKIIYTFSVLTEKLEMKSPTEWMLSISVNSTST